MSDILQHTSGFADAIGRILFAKICQTYAIEICEEEGRLLAFWDEKMREDADQPVIVERK